MDKTRADEGYGQSLVTETLAYVARALVSHPEDVSIEVVPGEGERTLFRVHVHPDDLGRVIGRGGAVARSIRRVAKAAAAKADLHVHVEIAG